MMPLASESNLELMFFGFEYDAGGICLYILPSSDTKLINVGNYCDLFESVSGIFAVIFRNSSP